MMHLVFCLLKTTSHCLVSDFTKNVPQHFFNGMITGQAASGISAWKPGSCQKDCGSMSNFAVLNLSQNVK